MSHNFDDLQSEVDQLHNKLNGNGGSPLTGYDVSTILFYIGPPLVLTVLLYFIKPGFIMERDITVPGQLKLNLRKLAIYVCLGTVLIYAGFYFWSKRTKYYGVNTPLISNLPSEDISLDDLRN